MNYWIILASTYKRRMNRLKTAKNIALMVPKRGHLLMFYTISRKSYK